MAQDPYQELGIARSADADAVRKAFRKLAKQHHPDANRGNKASEEKFKRLSAAFDLLGDAEKRKKFDAGEIDADGRDLHPGLAGGGFNRGRGPSPFGDEGGFQSASFEGVDLNDILGGMFGGGRGGRQGGGGFATRGGDVRARVDIDLEDTITGAKRRIAFSDGRTLDVTIPKGAVDGQTLRLRGQGAPGRAGAGDALIEIGLRPHPVFRRDGDSLTMDLPISVPDAVLGGKVQAPTPEGSVGRGLFDAAGRRGDLLARLMVTLPEASDAALEAFAVDWRDNRPYTPKSKT